MQPDLIICAPWVHQTYMAEIAAMKAEEAWAGANWRRLKREANKARRAYRAAHPIRGAKLNG